MRLAGGLPGTIKWFLPKYRHFFPFLKKKISHFWTATPAPWARTPARSRTEFQEVLRLFRTHFTGKLYLKKKDLTKLVVIGGFNLEDGDLDLVQVYDLSGDTPGDGLCNTLQVWNNVLLKLINKLLQKRIFFQFFPDSVQGASAALLDGGETIRVCGGGPIG